MIFLSKKKYYNDSTYSYRENKISFANNPEQKELNRLIRDSNTKIIFCTGNAGTGKALLNGTPILTKQGWKNIENLSLEDYVAGQDGGFYKVSGIYPQGEKVVYRITFSDRNYIDCCEEHLWTFQTRNQRDRKKGEEKNNFFPQTLTVKQILEEYPLKGPRGEANIFIPMCKPVNFQEKQHLIPPYLLGVLLGDGYLGELGSLSFTNKDQDVLDKTSELLKLLNMKLVHNNRYNYYIRKIKQEPEISSLKQELRRLNLMNTNSATKFIPEEYLIDSIDNRLELLRGLIDTDGYCGGSYYDICLKSKQLILDIKFIVESLGLTATYSEKHAICSNSSTGKKDCGLVYRLFIKTSPQIPKIHSSIKRESQWKKPQGWARRDIESIECLNYKKEMTCITIDSPDHLFLTNHCIVTHNTFSTLYTSYQLVREYKYDKILFSRNPVQLGEDMGFLPGDIGEKFNPFMACLFDNLNNIERLGGPLKTDMMSKIEITPIAFLRGRSLENCILIVDEAQNLDVVTLKAILTRIGEYCKVILLGSLNQIDDKKQAKKEKCDFVRVMEVLQDCDFVKTVELIQSKRSMICAEIDEKLKDLK